MRYVMLLGCVLFLGGIARGGVPGQGAVIDVISDEFESPWTFDQVQNRSSNGLWRGAFGGTPDVLELVTSLPGGTLPSTTAALRIRSLDTDDATPTEDSLVTQAYGSTLLGRSLIQNENPSLVCWVYLPPVSQWPVASGANQRSFGFGVLARDPGVLQAQYYPTIFAFRAPIGSGGQGYFGASPASTATNDIVLKPVDSAGGWYTLGLSWNASGQTEFYVAPGRVELTAADLCYTDTSSGRTMGYLVLHFFTIAYPQDALLSPDFLVDRCRVFTQSLPGLALLRSLAFSNNTFSMTIKGTTAGFAYHVQRKSALNAASWQDLETFVSDGHDRLFSDMTAGTRLFYRVSR